MAIKDTITITIEELECNSCEKHFYMFRNGNEEYDCCPYCEETAISLVQVIELNLNINIKMGSIDCVATQWVGSFNPIRKDTDNFNIRTKVTIDKNNSDKIIELIKPYLPTALASN
jgi:hypothetical protein